MTRNSPSLGEFYEGAVLMLCQDSLPGRTRFIGHAVREIRNRLPDAIAGPTRGPRLDYVKRVEAIGAAWTDAGLGRPANPNGDLLPPPTANETGGQSITIPAEVFRLIDALINDHRSVPETRAGATSRFFEACAPENKNQRETMRPVIRHWMDVTDWFMDRTHDSGKTDAACDPREFRRRFELFESTLSSLIGAFYASMDELDEILAAPDVSQVDKAVSLIARAEHHRYFFDKLNDARWVGPLEVKGFFRSPPPLVPVQGGDYVEGAPWPESHFLARIAGSAAEEEQTRIVAIACAMPETDNVSVQQDLADIALAVPPQMSVRLLPKARKWVAKYTFFLVPLKLGELAVHLARGGYRREAIDLARRLLLPSACTPPIGSGVAAGDSARRPRATAAL